MRKKQYRNCGEWSDRVEVQTIRRLWRAVMQSCVKQNMGGPVGLRSKQHGNCGEWSGRVEVHTTRDLCWAVLQSSGTNPTATVLQALW